MHTQNLCFSCWIWSKSSLVSTATGNTSLICLDSDSFGAWICYTRLLTTGQGLTTSEYMVLETTFPLTGLHHALGSRSQLDCVPSNMSPLDVLSGINLAEGHVTRDNIWCNTTPLRCKFQEKFPLLNNLSNLPTFLALLFRAFEFLLVNLFSVRYPVLLLS